MASHATKVRYVVCPKCHKLLMEFAHIPVYKCGGCGTVLRAKLYKANGENATSGSIDANQANTLLSIESSNGASISSEKQSAPCSSNAESLEVEHQVEKIMVSKLKSTPTKAEKKFQEKDNFLYIEQSYSMRNEASPDSSLDEELKEHLTPGKRGSDSQSVSSERNIVERAAVGNEFTGGSRSPSTRSYGAYDGGASSSDDGDGDRVQNKHVNLSRRTVRHRSGLDSADDEERGADALAKNVTSYRDQTVLHSSDIEGREGVDFLGANSMTNDDEERLEVISRRTYRNQKVLHSANAIESNDMANGSEEHLEGDDNVIGSNATTGAFDEHHTGDSVTGANGMSSALDEHREGDNLVGENGRNSSFTEHHKGDNVIGANGMTSTSDEHLNVDNGIGANAMISTFDDHCNEDMSGSSECHLDDKSLASNSPNDGHDSAIDGTSDSNEDELSSENRTHGRGWRTSVDSEEFYSVQNWQESENGGPSRSTSRGSTFLPDPPLYQNDISGTKLRSVEKEREELLRNQLGGLYDQRMKQSAQFSSTAHIQPMMHHHYSGRQVCYMPQHHQFSRIPFSSQSCSSCLHCLPPQSCCHSGPCYSSSHSMSSQSSEVPCSHKPQRDDDYESEKTHRKDKKPWAKRHCLPMLGAAPLVICTNCSTLLQLPADIIVSRSKQKLRCGACSKVFVFPFKGRARTDSPTSAETIHPSSEVDNKDDDLRGEPISFTEEYDLSFDNSCSTEIEIVQNTDPRSTSSTDEQRAAWPLHRLMGYHSARELLKTQLFKQPQQDIDGHLWERHGRKGASILNRHSADETSPSFMQKYEEDISPKKLKARKAGAPLRGMVKRGVRELNHGLESLKIKVHASRTAPAP